MPNSPHALLRLHNLSVLDISFNQLTVLPDSVRAMVALASLNITGNPLQVLPAPYALPQELRIIGLRSALAPLPPAESGLGAVAEHTSPDAALDGTPVFHGPQGQLDVTGILLAGLLPDGEAEQDGPDAEPKGPPPTE